MGTVLVAAAIAVGGILVAIEAFERTDTPAPEKSPAASLGPVGSVQTFDLGWEPRGIANDIASRDGYAWVSGSSHLTVFDPNGDQSFAPFKQGPFGLASTSTAIWAAGFEPGTGNYVARFPLASAVPDLMVPLEDRLGVSSLQATDSAVWVFGYKSGAEDGNLGTLLQIDPDTGTIVKTIMLRDAVPASVGNDPIVYASSADDGALWILTAEIAGGELGKLTLVRLDASTYVTRTYDPGLVAALVPGAGAVWLPAEHGTVRLDPETGNTTSIDLPTSRPSPIAASDRSVWFLGGTATEIELIRLDVDGERTQVGLDVSVPRHAAWGSVDASYDGVGSVWLLYEGGPLQKVSVGP